MDRWVDVLIKFLSVFVIEGIGELVMGYFFIIVGLSSSWIIRIHFDGRAPARLVTAALCSPFVVAALRRGDDPFGSGVPSFGFGT